MEHNNDNYNYDDNNDKWFIKKAGDGKREWSTRGDESGVDEKNEVRGKECCALLMFPRAWEGIETHRWKGSRIVCTIGKVGITK